MRLKVGSITKKSKQNKSTHLCMYQAYSFHPLATPVIPCLLGINLFPALKRKPESVSHLFHINFRILCISFF